MKKIAVVFLCLLTFGLFAQEQKERYSTVGITDEDYKTLIEDNSHGLAIDHFHKTENLLLEFVLSEDELTVLNDLGISYEVIIKDYQQHFKKLVDESANRRSVSCGLINFDSGNMGGYHTYGEMVSHITAMSELYSDYVTVSEIGKSIEDRPIFAVKISDNPEVNESESEGVVYFEALTHAREPMSLEATLYYMWWLLENIESDDEVRYLVNNREIYFVPIVNPDGYVYNEQTNPNGGGLWRKNRRNAGNGCWGVDINRNYPKGWGLQSGSSNNPCGQTYRGVGPLSEPESNAVANFIQQINPAIAFSSHAFGDKFLSPWGYVDSLASYELYAEFVSEFIPPTYSGYGTTAQMLDYTSSGTTRDYLHESGVLAWTPEIGHDFWESPFVICDRVEEFRGAMKYLTWVAGNYTCFNNLKLKSQNIVLGGEISFDIRVKNRGLTRSSSNIKINVIPDHPSISTITGQVNLGSINKRSYAESTDGAFKFEVNSDVLPGEQIPFLVEIYEESTISYRKTVYLTAGNEEILFQTDFETDNAWTYSDNDWDTCVMDAVSGFQSFADSPEDNYNGFAESWVILGEKVDLSLATLPYASFNAKWSLEPNRDFVSFLASTDGGINWIKLSGAHTNLNNEYTTNSHWVQERVDLHDFLGEAEVSFAFLLESDGSVQSDGIYIDDFKVSDFDSQNVTNLEMLDNEFSRFSLVPNPSNGQTEIRFYSLSSERVLLKIFSLNGAIVYDERVSSVRGENTILINSSAFNAGMYIIDLQNKKGNMRYKMIVE